VLPQPESTTPVAADPVGMSFAIWCGAFGYNSFQPDRQYLFTLTVE
jgi:hypothetical protein